MRWYQSSNGKWSIGIVLGLAAFSLIGLLVDPDRDPAAVARGASRDAYYARERAELLTKMEVAGILVKRTCAGNEAQVSSVGWMALDADGKRNVTTALAAGARTKATSDA